MSRNITEKTTDIWVKDINPVALREHPKKILGLASATLVLVKI